MFVGGETRQRTLIEDQIHQALSSIVYEPFVCGKITHEIRLAPMYMAGLGRLNESVAHQKLQDSFWKAFFMYEMNSFQRFEKAWPNPLLRVLSGPMKELGLYLDFSCEMNWDIEEERILMAGEVYVRHYFKFLLDKLEELSLQSNLVSSYEWFLIIESILLLSHNSHFCHVFGNIIVELRFRLHSSLNMTEQITNNHICSSCYKVMNSKGSALECISCRKVYETTIAHECIRCNGHEICKDKCRRCKFHYETRTCNELFDLSCLEQKYDNDSDDLLPSKPESCMECVRVQIPKSITSEHHFGHIPYEFCQLMDRWSSKLHSKNS